MRQTLKVFQNRIVRYILGVVLLAPFIYYAGSNSLENLAKPKLSYIALSFFFTVFAYYIDSLRWGIITNDIARKKVCSYKDYFFMYSSSMSIGQFISQAGGMLFLRPLMLKKHGLRYSYSYVAIIIEKSADLFFLFIFLLNSFIYLFVISDTKIITVILSASIIISCFLYAHFGFLFEKFFYLLKKYNKYFKNEDTILHKTHFGHARNLHLYSKIAIISILRIFVFSLRLLFLAYGVNVSISYLVILFGIPVGQLSLLFSFTPGATGVLEGGWFGVLKLANVSKEIIGDFLVGQRFYWIVFSLLTLGLCYLLNKLNFAFPFDDSTS